MTKQEFEALGITSHDLVCVEAVEEDYRLVGSLCHTTHTIYMGTDPSRASKGFGLHSVKSIEIIKKNFWSDK